MGAVLGAAALLGACGMVTTEEADDTVSETTGSVTTGTGPTATTTPPNGETVSLDLAHVRLETVVAGLREPTALATRNGFDNFYIAEREGRIRIVTRVFKYDKQTAFEHLTKVELETSPLIDLRSSVDTYGERGLRGLTFSSDGTRLYVSYNDQSGATVVDEFTMKPLEDRVDSRSRRTILTVPQPAPNHNGGHLAFGHDGYLYLALGDGGGSGDPLGEGQNTQGLLGSLLRIDVDVDPDGAVPYAIPDSNWYLDGTQGRPEIFLIGLRDPYRFSFDYLTGDLWIADQGEQRWEEIDVMRARDGGGVGKNLGWNVFEGRHEFSERRPVPRYQRPVHEYSHDAGGCGVIGGYVYRGQQISGLRGAYVFADRCLGVFEGILVRGGEVADHRAFPIQLASGTLTSFAEDDDGELYVLTTDGRLQQIVVTGQG